MESGECLHTLLGHTAEIVSLNFDTNGQRVMTGSFDHTVKCKCVCVFFFLVALLGTFCILFRSLGRQHSIFESHENKVATVSGKERKLASKIDSCCGPRKA